MSVGSYHKQSASSGLITLQASAVDIKRFADFARLVPKAMAAAQRRTVRRPGIRRGRRNGRRRDCCAAAGASLTLLVRGRRPEAGF